MKKNVNTVAKPGGTLCNLACDYCFYLKNSVIRTACRMMDDTTLEAYICHTLCSTPSQEVSFCWQGGEPLLCGLDFFKQVVALQHCYRGNKTVRNSLQTNGVLLNNQWVHFLKKHEFLVGLSIDAPLSLHNTWRKNRAGKPSYKKVSQAVRCLQAHDVAVNVMVVVSHQSEIQGEIVYRWLTHELNLQYLQFIPLVEPGTPCGVSARGWGDYLCAVFDAWLAKDVGRVFIQLFDNLLGVWMGLPATLCTMQPICGQSLLVEKNGDVYSCDHFVVPKYKLGNLACDSLALLENSSFQQQFGQQKALLSERCTTCHWRFACHGGCPKHRVLTPDNEPQNVLCDGYLTFFRHISPYMNVMRQLLLNHQPPAQIMGLIPEIRQKICALTLQD